MIEVTDPHTTDQRRRHVLAVIVTQLPLAAAPAWSLRRVCITHASLHLARGVFSSSCIASSIVRHRRREEMLRVRRAGSCEFI